MTKSTDFPFADVSRKAAILSSQGHVVYQKFSCAACGKRNTASSPGIFLDVGTCAKCGKRTDLRQIGCNYEIK